MKNNTGTYPTCHYNLPFYWRLWPWQHSKKKITHIIKEVKLYLQIIQRSIHRILLGPLKLRYDQLVVFSDTRSILKVFFLCTDKDQSKNENKIHFTYNSIKQYKTLRN